MDCRRPRPARSNGSGCVTYDLCVSLAFTPRVDIDAGSRDDRPRNRNRCSDGRRLEDRVVGPRCGRYSRPWCCCTKDWAASLSGATCRNVSPRRPAVASSRILVSATDSPIPRALPRPMTYMHDEALRFCRVCSTRRASRRAILIGHSDGGSIAAIHAGAVRDPRIAGIVLIAAHFFVEDLNIASIARIRDRVRNDRPADSPRALSRQRRYRVPRLERCLARSAVSRFDITGYLPDINVPVLALQGADDPYGTEAQLQVARASRPLAARNAD